MYDLIIAGSEVLVAEGTTEKIFGGERRLDERYSYFGLPVFYADFVQIALKAGTCNQHREAKQDAGTEYSVHRGKNRISLNGSEAMPGI